MADHVDGFRTAVAGFAVVIVLAACGGSPDPQPARATSMAKQMETSATESAPPNATKPQPVDREVFRFTGFVSPTGNVSCMIDVDLARCDIIDRDWSPPPRPADCEYDYGQGIAISLGESAQFVCAGDTAFGPDEVLPYGDAITAGSMRCESAESGIACSDVESGRGFSISLQAYRLF